MFAQLRNAANANAPAIHRNRSTASTHACAGFYASSLCFFGTPVADPERATTILLYPFLTVGTDLTFQALIVDPASASPKGVSTTNAVRLFVLP